VSAKIDDDDLYAKKLGLRLLVEHERRERELAEERRVLYVAFTRAQEMLLLQGLERMQEECYQAWVDRALGGLASRADVRVLRAADLPAATLAPAPLACRRSRACRCSRRASIRSRAASHAHERERAAPPARAASTNGSLLGVPERTRLPDASERAKSR
jgi:ATP-dependent exoDNAse (exonuclease V) beta subunit